jgi:tetratricopeptide (TPR) repeat protein
MGARGSLHARQWPGSPSGGEAVKWRGFILTVILMTGGWRGLRTRFACVLAPALWLALAASPAAAQVSQQASYADPSFQTILNNPGNLASQVKYAAGAKDDPDIENAISAYDRLLFYNPALARVRFELGVLYARLGSYQQARAYFESALQMRDITPEMAEHAQRYIAILDRKLSPDQFTGFAQTGLRYQTNATLGPGPQPVLASGRNFNSAFTARPDWNWFGSFALNYSHDFGTQDGDALEATLIGYDAQQFKVHQVDLGLAELRAGPRFVFPDMNGASVKPYVAATGSLLADQVYSGGVGGA